MPGQAARGHIGIPIAPRAPGVALYGARIDSREPPPCVRDRPRPGRAALTAGRGKSRGITGSGPDSANRQHTRIGIGAGPIGYTRQSSIRRGRRSDTSDRPSDAQRHPKSRPILDAPGAVSAHCMRRSAPSGREFDGPAGRRADEVHRIDIRLKYSRRPDPSPARMSAPTRRTATPSHAANRPRGGQSDQRPRSSEWKFGDCVNPRSIFDGGDMADIDPGEVHTLTAAR